MKNVVNPSAVSIETALRNLAVRLTGRPLEEMPRTLEGIVQFMAENVPTAEELTAAILTPERIESIVQEVIARLEGDPEQQPMQAGATLILSEGAGDSAGDAESAGASPDTATAKATTKKK